MSSLEEYLRNHICNNCHVSLMYEHPENKDYLKCVFCGFCKKREKSDDGRRN
jgi:hypothetical protein